MSEVRALWPQLRKDAQAASATTSTSPLQCPRQHAHRGWGQQSVLDSLSPQPFSAPCSLLATRALSSPAGVARVRTKERVGRRTQQGQTSQIPVQASRPLPLYSQPAVPARRRDFASSSCQMEGKFCRSHHVTQPAERSKKRALSVRLSEHSRPKLRSALGKPCPEHSLPAAKALLALTCKTHY